MVALVELLRRSRSFAQSNNLSLNLSWFLYQDLNASHQVGASVENLLIYFQLDARIRCFCLLQHVNYPLSGLKTSKLLVKIISKNCIKTHFFNCLVHMFKLFLNHISKLVDVISVISEIANHTGDLVQFLLQLVDLRIDFIGLGCGVERFKEFRSWLSESFDFVGDF